MNSKRTFYALEMLLNGTIIDLEEEHGGISKLLKTERGLIFIDFNTNIINLWYGNSFPTELIPTM